MARRRHPGVQGTMGPKMELALTMESSSLATINPVRGSSRRTTWNAGGPEPVPPWSLLT